MLFWHKHCVEKALADLANFTPFPDEWTVEDKVLFEQAFSFHGKSFHRIRQMVRNRGIPTCEINRVSCGKYFSKAFKFGFFQSCKFLVILLILNHRLHSPVI